ncbi:putative ATP-binding protein involved in virulence [Raoultella ornithinolytica]|uniref:restriction system-associated AAA family ATPase n=1 Tax=Raoultella ornithinolytica TaxID=54291 RepID=UPI0007227825|nr:restriction system-associated AAA family ATPase [Raoultella ornithinolytica]ALQ45357.1 putative ATP-binding protein involved in virulence [Raoultella ornithinolytica]MDV1095906.1 restriction system-associated AAA family ATPase [Raoultella ornithinolytica]MDV1123753.1 restriction system-associated AAA family ATPase [Raoultella ornithinolytica]MDV1894055.1 restriction system-associated AAA family ATPase [Raoultella ornithinolytica]
MRLTYIKIYEADACGSLLNGLTISLDREAIEDNSSFSTLCLVGPNGSGKSQFLQTIAEIFQDAWHTHAPEQERAEPNKGLAFEIIYDLELGEQQRQKVKLSRLPSQKSRAAVRMDKECDGNWSEVSPNTPLYGQLLPPIVVGYTSGDNETLSLPFFKSRAGYAKAVSSAALDPELRTKDVPNNRLLLIDYGTNLEVLIANLMLGTEELADKMLEHAALAGLASWRCIIQLQPSTLSRTKPINGRRGVKLTEELEKILINLRNCSTCQHHDEITDTYTLDFFVDAQTRSAFKEYWDDAAELYRSFHKLAMLNDLAIRRKVRNRLARQIKRGHFATRLPEPQDEDKVFRFEEVRFHAKKTGDAPVDYVALSDGEHQQAQIFGVFSMITETNALFLLDEPESHFNPQWRLKFITRLKSIPTPEHTLRELILTSHAPFVPSDLRREQVVIFKRVNGNIEARNPPNETFGASFDRILKDCFSVEPPISQVARDEIGRLMNEGEVSEIEEALPNIGVSVEKAFLIDHLNQLKNGEK